MKALEKQIAQVISRHRLLPQGKERPVLVALSGGADSVALLRLLLRLGYTCHAAHCNFHLRGDESERDELFVRQLCQRLGVTLHVQDFATADYAAAHKVSIEMAARQLRYDWFKRLRAETGCQAVAVAHHRDDNVETLLLNLLRGSGLHGLTGMDYRRDGIVRPLLDVSRQQLTGYLGKLGQDYVTDSTNLQPDAAADDTLQATIERLREADRLVSDSVSQAIADTVATHDDGTESLDINKLQQFAAEYGVRICWHGPGDMSPLAHAANIHIDLAAENLGLQEWSGIEPPNFVIQKLAGPRGALLEVFPGLPEYGNDGFVYANDKPGLGVDLNEKEAAKYPCSDEITTWTQTRNADGSLQTP